jgi:hypothetical protein
MNHNSIKMRIRKDAMDEARQDEEQEARLEERLRKWKRGAAGLGIGLATSVVMIVPFLKGHSLHDQWDSIGKKILVLSMCLLVGFMYSAGITYTCWSYLNGIKKINRKFAPPGSRYRMGKNG